MHYYQHHIGDFIRDTSRLPDSHCMAYLRMIWMYYESEGPLPNNPAVIALKIGADQCVVLSILEAFFTLENGVWTHKRCDSEIAAYVAICERNKTNGKAGGRPKKTQSVSSGLRHETDTEPCRNPNQYPVTNKEHTNTDVLVVASDADADLLGQAISKDKSVPNCPHETLLALYAECLPSLPQPRAWEGQAADNLRARWRWVLTAKGRTTGKRYATNASEAIEWFRRFFDYVGSSDFLMGRKADWQADIRWLVKAANFDKVLSGAYENERATA